MPHPKNPKPIVAVAAVAAFLATFNQTVLNVGFAPIMADLAVDVATVQWLATAYMLGAAVMVPVSAFAYRSFPTRPLFCATCSLLVTGSVVGVDLDCALDGEAGVELPLHAADRPYQVGHRHARKVLG